MIRRPPTPISLGLDSLTDLMTNMMGLILLMVGITSVMSGGMRLTLLSHWANPGQREPLYLVCTADRIRFMHRGDRWLEELGQVCRQLEGELGRRPTTGEAIREANRVGLGHSPDFHPMFVREVARQQGQEVYLIGIRFLPRDPADSGSDVPVTASLARRHVHPPVAELRRGGAGGPEWSSSAIEALAAADPDATYLDVFVYEDGFDTLVWLQQEAEQRQLRLFWRPMLTHQAPGLSETGFVGRPTGGSP
jgi:hypothetical protein